MTHKARLENLADYGYGPLVMKLLKVCPDCGSLLPANASRCPECHSHLPRQTLFDRYKRLNLTCPHCKNLVSKDSLFCPRCGREMKIKEKTLLSKGEK